MNWWHSSSQLYRAKEAAVQQEPHCACHLLFKKINKNKKPFHTSQIQIDELQRERKSDHNQPVYELDSRSVRLAGLAVIVIESLTG